MEEQERPASRATLPVILIAAVVQGWALYGLHFAGAHKYWPATDPAWLIGLYTIALLLPLTVQLMAEHVRKPAMAAMVGVLAIALFYMGWHNGSLVGSAPGEFAPAETFMPFGLEMAVLWLLTLPFLQARLVTGAWRFRYDVLFATAWRNKLVLAEAALFTGAFWLLLMLWQSLFKMLGIRFFHDLFAEWLFVYPVTAITFGLALHLIGSVERFIAIVLEQLLNVLKWLALVAGVLLALFTAALIFKLPGLFVTGQRAIGAAWLLWLVAVTVLLVNAAYRDGGVDRPYPRWIATALRMVVPLTTIIALTALYALYVRTARYGLTVERVWAFVVAGATVVYAVGYALAAVRGGRWMDGIARVNIVAALLLIAAIALALTPVLSPYRLAAKSQAHHVLTASTVDTSSHDSSLKYLRFSAGEYGRAKLRELEKLEGHPRAAEIRKAATAVLLAKNSRDPVMTVKIEEQLANLRVIPAGAVMDAELRKQVIALFNDTGRSLGFVRQEQEFGLAVFIDLNGDSVDEFILVDPHQAFLFEQRADQWSYQGILSIRAFDSQRLPEGIDAADISTRAHRWKILVVGKREYQVESDR